jgi:DNA replication licensing factor MCM4
MEQQTVSIAKSGIICTLNARTSILASANPVESRYNPNLSVVENIKLPPTLLSRFDLIYLILDKSDPVADRRLAQHIVSLYYPPGDRRASETSSFTHPQLTEYISWAKANISPSMTNAAAVKLTNGYVEMRQSGNLGGGKKTIAATPRQLESLIRLAEAHARMQLKELVEEADVVEAIRLMNVATQKTATDPVTGTIDMDAIHTGRTAAQRNTVANLKEFLNRKSIGEDVAFADIVNHLNSVSDTAMGEDDLINYLNQLSEEGYVRMDTPSNSVRVLRNDGSKGAAAAAPPMSQMGTETME